MRLGIIVADEAFLAIRLRLIKKAPPAKNLFALLTRVVA